MLMINQVLPSLVKEVRRQFALSQEDLDRELDVTFPTINRLENGLSKPSTLARAQLDTFCKRMQAARILSLSEACHG